MTICLFLCLSTSSFLHFTPSFLHYYALFLLLISFYFFTAFFFSSFQKHTVFYFIFYISLQVLFTFTICTSLSYSQSLYLTSFLNFSLTFSLFRRYISLTIVCVFCLFAIIVIIISLLFMKNWVSIVSKNRFVFFLYFLTNEWNEDLMGQLFSIHYTLTHTHTEERTKMIL